MYQTCLQLPVAVAGACAAWRRFCHVTSCPGCVGALILFWAMLELGYFYILTPANHFKQMLGVLCAKKYIPSTQSLATTLTSRPS